MDNSRKKGFIIIQIDGLSYGVLENTIKNNKVPFLKFLIDKCEYAIRKEFGRSSGRHGMITPHVIVPSIRARKSNNRIERFHGTEKERTKVMRGFDQEQGCADLMNGFRVHYNLVKSHQTLGCTPSEATGSTLVDGFRWHNILKLAIKN